MAAPPRHGYTLLEIVVVLGMMAVLITLAAPAYRGFERRKSLEENRTAVVDALRLAQSRAVTGRSDASWGVKLLAPATFVVFRGPAYAAGDAQNISYVLRGAAFVSTAVWGGSDAVVFARSVGTASSAGSIQLRSASTGGTASVSVGLGGVAE